MHASPSPWSVVNEYCAFWRDLFIYSADVGMGDSWSPSLLHSHVTHQAILEMLQLLQLPLAVLSCLYTFIYLQFLTWKCQDRLYRKDANGCGYRLLLNKFCSHSVDTNHLVLFSSVAVKLTLSFSLFCIDIESLYPCPISGSVLCKDNNTILYFVMLSIILSLVVHSTTWQLHTFR